MSQTEVDLQQQGLFPCDAEVARRLSMGADKFRRLAPALERAGFPTRDPLVGNRYWPAVKAFWDNRYGLATLRPSVHEDGEENLDALRGR
ncbi:hypothetical protein [Terrihabitans rhizophilus]|uniref:Winged helix-turn-helix domain-containing protein n=1 Tax=Terrihabitans rhizophilus TaxID=3092662 RepID=A0ABU4RQH5_9HYPH|nr:hypothetical protein [Terrihabitans sp. PJ23]MDX6806349.1 hypothetical protein [Terrihabitans sp. PJ23]